MVGSEPSKLMTWVQTQAFFAKKARDYPKRKIAFGYNKKKIPDGAPKNFLENSL